MPTKRLTEMQAGDRTSHYTFLEPLRENSEGLLIARVKWYDGGESLRAWEPEMHDFELEVLEPAP